MSNTTQFHSPKNSTDGFTYQFKNERERLTKFYNSTPFYGNKLAETLYTTVRKVLPSLIQASVCGISVSLVTYKQDADKAAELLSAAFKKPVKRLECHYTGFITCHILNK